MTANADATFSIGNDVSTVIIDSGPIAEINQNSGLSTGHLLGSASSDGASSVFAEVTNGSTSSRTEPRGLTRAQTVYEYLNEGSTQVRAYLDFTVDSFSLLATYSSFAPPVPSFALLNIGTLFVPSNGISPGFASLYAARLGRNASDPSELFDASVINASSDFSCGNFPLSAVTCAGMVSGTIDLGLIDPGEGFSLSYALSVETHAAQADARATVAARASGSTTGASSALRFVPQSQPVVPEPASWALMIGGFACMGGALRRRVPGPVRA